MMMQRRMMLTVFSMAVLALGAGCASTPVENTTDGAQASSRLVKRHSCNVAGLTDAEIADCIAWVTNETHDPAYCPDPGYDCDDFANTFCGAAEGAYGIACAEMGVGCSTGGGHAVNIVFFPDKGCMIIEPQTGTVIGTFEPVDGSCNTYSKNHADAVCDSVNAGTAVCGNYFDGTMPDPFPCTAL